MRSVEEFIAKYKLKTVTVCRENRVYPVEEVNILGDTIRLRINAVNSILLAIDTVDSGEGYGKRFIAEEMRKDKYTAQYILEGEELL